MALVDGVKSIVEYSSNPKPPSVSQMPMGRMCVDHYRQLNRYCVFSHDEMVCKMASKADTTMDVALASAVQRDMTVMLQEEDKLRDKVSKMVRGLLCWHTFI